MPDPLRHLPLLRLDPVNPRRTRRAVPRRSAPEDPGAHARRLSEALAQRIEASAEETGAFDPRLLMKLEVEGIQPEDLEAVPGLQLVSQEGRSIVVLFADAAGLSEFRNRLNQIVAGRRPVRQEVLFAIRGIDGWNREDRKGPALRREGAPATEPFVIDVELWPLERRPDRQRMIESFRHWCNDRSISVLDLLNKDPIILCRVRYFVHPGLSLSHESKISKLVSARSRGRRSACVVRSRRPRPVVLFGKQGPGFCPNFQHRRRRRHEPGFPV